MLILGKVIFKLDKVRLNLGKVRLSFKKDLTKMLKLINVLKSRNSKINKFNLIPNEVKRRFQKPELIYQTFCQID
jgi:hypothetical protein